MLDQCLQKFSILCDAIISWWTRKIQNTLLVLTHFGIRIYIFYFHRSQNSIRVSIIWALLAEDFLFLKSKRRNLFHTTIRILIGQSKQKGFQCINISILQRVLLKNYSSECFSRHLIWRCYAIDWLWKLNEQKFFCRKNLFKNRHPGRLPKTDFFPSFMMLDLIFLQNYTCQVSHLRFNWKIFLKYTCEIFSFENHLFFVCIRTLLNSKRKRVPSSLENLIFFL